MRSTLTGLATEQISTSPPSRYLFPLRPSRESLAPSIQDRADSLIQNLSRAPNRTEEEREDLIEWREMFRTHEGREAADDLALLFTRFSESDEEIMLMLDEILETISPRQTLEEYMEEFNRVSNLALHTAEAIYADQAAAETAHQETLAFAEMMEEIQLIGSSEQRQELATTLHLAVSESRRVQSAVQLLHERMTQASETLSSMVSQTEELGKRQEQYDTLLEENTNLLSGL